MNKRGNKEALILVLAFIFFVGAFVVAFSSIEKTLVPVSKNGSLNSSNNLNSNENSFLCSDGIDNDGDGFTDYPADVSCSAREDNDERNPISFCQDGIDNDNDGWVDVSDLGCVNTQDSDEHLIGTTQCSDELDNDLDTKIDGYDPDCADSLDLNESGIIDTLFACSDGIDNDNDTLIDYPADIGCSYASDTNETDTVILIHDPLLCYGFGDDRDYLYNVTTTVFTKPDGKQSFIISFNGTILRTNYSGEQFFDDHSNGALQISYAIVPYCGGVDITYTVINPTSQSQLLPDFKTEGIKQPKTNAQFLAPKEWGTLADATGGGPYYQIPYPSDVTYSPIMVSVNNNLSVGSSFEYPYLQYKHNIIPFLWWFSDGSMTQSYALQYTSIYVGNQTAYIKAGEQRTYTTTLRFSSRRNWLLTLAPYKTYFNSLYGSAKQNHQKDLHPIKGFIEAFQDLQNDVTNPRGYHWYSTGSRLDQTGWGPEVTYMLDFVRDNGYRRAMIWVPSGLFGNNSVSLNFPPQFMGDWLPNLTSSAGELARFSQAGITLGWWWGHAGSIPVPNVWNPERLDDANYSNSAHRAFLENELSLAVNDHYGREIGLDAVGAMPVYDRWIWIDRMKQLAPGVNFYHENGGPDLIHAKINNFYTDRWDPITQSEIYIGGPHLLSWYLNPQSEIAAVSFFAGEEYNQFGGAPALQARAQQLTTWGYTYGDYWGANASRINIEVSQCLDHMDNDHDGKADWPYDMGCTNEFDENEN